jgi:glucan phosphoethanolaminetransferase (alkaline phosphatase superfamily)
MPTHLYKTKHVPPKFYDIILAHALEIAIAAFSVVAGLLVGLNAKDLDVFASTTPLRFLPIHLLYGLAIFLFVGGLTALFGVLVRRNNIRAELNVEQTGWLILCAGWMAYAWAAIYYADGAAMSYIFAGAVALGSALRAVALFATERQLDAAVREGVETGSLPIKEETDG